ncbi:MAG TPA: folylpolyglutamate synthase/dihydrofolate synthase family protein [Acidobacteriaceae bacterium]|nr:folylpolyglutamate synthase/dihydrofolate synthase family protein [Acidobacteriaceae bacterium]
MSYALAIERLAALGQELHTAPGKPRRKFELGHMRALMASLGDPQREFASILVAGTNGKGSTSATLASILAHAGYSTGLYTSPHLSRVNERVQVDGTPIPDEDFAALFFRVEKSASRLVRQGELPGLPSFFETVTAIGFSYFAQRRIHTAVLEVGMGGRLDATNIVEPLISIITDISLDHMEWLGSTIREIAKEKAGILRPHGVMVTLPQHPEANQALGEAAVALGVRGVNAAEYVPAQQIPQAQPGPEMPQASAAPMRNRYSISTPAGRLEVDSPLSGAHQQRNLALAIAAAFELRNNHGYNISDGSIQAGIRETVWPGRLESLPGHGLRAPVLLDVGHNPAGAWALRSAVSHLDRGQPLTLVFGCLKDKPAGELAQILFPLFTHVVVTPVDSPRSAALSDLLAAAEATGSQAEAAADPLSALHRALSLTPAEGLVVITGSVYLVGQLRDELKSHDERVGPALAGAGRLRP